MRLVTEILEMKDILNPRGGAAKDLEMVCKRASWLSLVCSHWLSHKHDNPNDARYEEPDYNLPKAFPDATRFNKARKECGAWDRPRVKYGTPSWAERWDWSWVFDYWMSGGLDAEIKNIMEMLPEVNVERINKELML